ncbi:MAG: hypothetical protein ABIH41_06115 [Nanoarchaeota archaeon]
MSSMGWKGSSWLSMFLVVILVMLVSQGVSADMVLNKYTNDFSFIHRDDRPLNVCACGSAADTYEVVNVGNVESTFRVELDSSSDMFRVDAQSFTLSPGQRRSFTVSMTVPCDQRGMVPYQVSVVTHQGRRKTISHAADVVACQNIGLRLDVYDQVIDQCQQTRFDVMISNTASFTDSFNVAAEGFEDEVRFSESSVTILPAESKTIVGYLRMPCDVSGPITVPLQVTSLRNGGVAKVDYAVDIKDVSRFSVEVDSPSDVCSMVPGSFTVNMRNWASFQNTYDLFIQGQSFASLSDSSLSLLPGEQKSVHVSLNPSRADEGSASIDLLIVPAIGARQTVPISIAVDRCFDHQVGFEVAKDSVCCGSKSYHASVRNLGSSADVFDVELLSPVPATLSRSAVSLDPGEFASLDVDVDLPCVEGFAEIVLQATARSTGAVSKDSLVIEHESDFSCHLVSLASDKVHVRYDAPQATIQVLSSGLVAGQYAASIESQFLSVDESTVDVGPSGAVVHLAAQNLPEFRPGIYVDTLTLTHLESGEKYIFTLEVSVQDVPFSVQVYRKLAGDAVCLAAFIALLIIIILAVAFVFLAWIVRALRSDEDHILMLRRRSYSQERMLAIALLIVAIFAVLLVALLAHYDGGKYVPVQERLYYEMFEDTSLMIDLNQYFSDPDQDVLVYRPVSGRNLSIDIVDGVATIAPVRDYFGTETVVFRADDQRGGVVDSPVITIKIIDVPEPSAGAWLRSHCAFSFWLIALIIVIGMYVLEMRRGRLQVIRRARQVRAPRARRSSRR